jgi:hypothetical protein
MQAAGIVAFYLDQNAGFAWGKLNRGNHMKWRGAKKAGRKITAVAGSSPAHKKTFFQIKRLFLRIECLSFLLTMPPNRLVRAKTQNL